MDRTPHGLLLPQLLVWTTGGFQISYASSRSFCASARLCNFFSDWFLDLADPLAGDVEGPPDLVQRARMLVAEPVAKLEHAALAVGEVLQRLAQRFLGEDFGRPLEGGLGALIGDELAELRPLLVADRLLEGDRGLGRALDRVDLLGLDAR